MVSLSPRIANFPKYPACPNRQVYPCFSKMEETSLSSHGVEHLAVLVNGIVIVAQEKDCGSSSLYLLAKNGKNIPLGLVKMTLVRRIAERISYEESKGTVNLNIA